MALAAGLKHFADLGLRHQRDVGCDLRQGRGDQPEKANRLGQGVAHGVPCHQRLAQSEFAGECRADAVAIVAERRKVPTAPPN